ncbi:hypothetical protein R3W88_024302 [Solanum pinnatisectum]|uniref:Uncharacterized protein n=1 Tax=Solanum pinnatisectum TaxID=50273 RepID=A0AAV9M389_9SOLN|nr:hypothetical protein R3W88_024302 [Solanum pinnatisectum]
MAGMLNQENNHDNEPTPKQRMESVQQEQEKLITKETTDVNVQRKMQGDQDTTQQQTQAAQHTNVEERTGVSKEEQHAKREKATWKVKGKINSKGNTMHQSKEDEGKQSNNNNKKGTGKLVNFAPNSYALKNPLCNNLHSSQNEHEKGNSVMQAGVNEVYEQTEKITHKGHNMEPKIPPAIKLDQTPKGNQQNEKGKEKIQSNRQTNAKGPAENDTIHKEKQWQIQNRRKNKNHQQNQDQGKNQNSQVQVQVQQAKISQDQQSLQRIGINSKALVIEIEKFGDQILTPPSPFIVDDDEHHVNYEIPAPVFPTFVIVADEAVGGRMELKEKTTNLQEGEPRGRELSHVLHEN